MRYTWSFSAPGMEEPAPYWAMADIAIDNDLVIGNGLMQLFRSTNNPGEYSGSSEMNLMAGNTYDFFVTAYHYQSFVPDYAISSSMVGDFGFGFSPISVPEPTTISIFAIGLLGLACSRRYLKR